MSGFFGGSRESSEYNEYGLEMVLGRVMVVGFRFLFISCGFERSI